MLRRSLRPVQDVPIDSLPRKRNRKSATGEIRKDRITVVNKKKVSKTETFTRELQVEEEEEVEEEKVEEKGSSHLSPRILNVGSKRVRSHQNYLFTPPSPRLTRSRKQKFNNASSLDQSAIGTPPPIHSSTPTSISSSTTSLSTSIHSVKGQTAHPIWFDPAVLTLLYQYLPLPSLLSTRTVNGTYYRASLHPNTWRYHAYDLTSRTVAHYSLSLLGLHTLTVNESNIRPADTGIDDQFVSELVQIHSLTSFYLINCTALTDEVTSIIVKGLPRLTSIGIINCMRLSQDALTPLCISSKKEEKSTVRRSLSADEDQISSSFSSPATLMKHADSDASSEPMSSFSSRLSYLSSRSNSNVLVKPTAVFDPSQLRSLDLTKYRSCSGVSLIHFYRMDSLEALNLRGCRELNDAALENLKHLAPTLTSLDLSFCIHLTDLIGSTLASLTRLRHLALVSCILLTDQLMGHLANLPLQILDLSNLEQLTGAGIYALENYKDSPQLEKSSFRMANDDDTDEIEYPYIFVCAFTLEVLRLRFCRRLEGRWLRRLAFDVVDPVHSQTVAIDSQEKEEEEMDKLEEEEDKEAENELKGNNTYNSLSSSCSSSSQNRRNSQTQKKSAFLAKRAAAREKRRKERAEGRVARLSASGMWRSLVCIDCCYCPDIECGAKSAFLQKRKEVLLKWT